MDAQIENDGLDLSQLKDQIRKDAENRKRNGAPSFYRQLITQTFDAQTPPLPPLQLQPKLEKRDRYQLNDLLAFHDEPFIRNAYKAILKRELATGVPIIYRLNADATVASKVDLAA